MPGFFVIQDAYIHRRDAKEPGRLKSFYRFSYG